MARRRRKNGYSAAGADVSDGRSGAEDSSRDACTTILANGTTCGIHESATIKDVLREPVALGLVPLIVFRPWLDGVTYPTGNFYFVWGMVALGCLFVGKMLARGAEPRFKRGTLLLAGFWLVGLLTLATTLQYDATYRAVVIWAGYVFMFVALVNGVKTRTGYAIVLSAFLAVVLTEAAYSLLHFRYILPMVREAVMRDPHLIRMRFGTDTPSEELIHRLQVNRSFGSLLYPNALAAFLILALPVAATECGRAFAAVWPRPAGRRPTRPAFWKIVLTGIGVWLAAAVVAHMVTEFVGAFEFPVARGVVRHGPVTWSAEQGYGIAATGYLLKWLVRVGVLPLVLGASVALVVRTWGYRGLGLGLRLVALPLLLAIGLRALWLTFSRGGALALVGAVAVTVLLMVAARLKHSGYGRAAASLAAGLLLAAVLPCLMGQGPAPNAPAQPPAVAAGQEAGATPLKITKEGMDLTAADLANPASLRLRLTYWQTGLNMLLDNFWTGVGLGNFGTVYPNYKAPDAGEVKAAHNDYLQAFCETGVLGFLLFAGFWAYFAIWGALRIYHEPDSGERWALIGLYAGLLAFLAHSLVDFNFFNPALSFFAFLAAGLFVSRALMDTPEPAPARNVRLRNQMVALPLLLLGALVCGMGLRVYLSDLIVGGYRFFAVGDDQRMEQIFYDGQFFFPPVEANTPDRKPRAIPARYLGGLVPRRSALEELGNFRVRVKPDRMRALGPDENVPVTALFVVPDVEGAKKKVLPYVDTWLANLRRADRIYPYNPKLSAHFMKWYDLLVFSLPPGEARRRYILEYVKWAEETVRRSPREFQYQTALGKALWLRANIEPDVAARQRYFLDGLEAYKRAMELYPASPATTRGYGQALINYGSALEKDADLVGVKPGKGAAMVKEGRQMLRRADQLEKG